MTKEWKHVGDVTGLKTTDFVKNRFTSEACVLPAFAIAVYDVIMGSEMFQDWKSQRKGLDWFIKYFPKQYMVLLD